MSGPEAGAERREYFRISTFARVTLRALDDRELEGLRQRLRAKRVPSVLSPLSFDERRHSPENRPLVELLQHIALALERIDEKLDVLTRVEQARSGAPAPEGLEIVLSGSGFSGAFGLKTEPGDPFEARIDLWDSGVPLILAIARVAHVQIDDDGRPITAFGFEEILSDDRERIIQFAMRNQTQTIREGRMEERS
ncbi:MAG: hypothetical protein ACE5FG_03800 [Myxococcota bacterium]